MRVWRPRGHGYDDPHVDNEAGDKDDHSTSVFGEFSQQKREYGVSNSKTDHHKPNSVNTNRARDEGLERMEVYSLQKQEE